MKYDSKKTKSDMILTEYWKETVHRCFGLALSRHTNNNNKKLIIIISKSNTYLRTTKYLKSK